MSVNTIIFPYISLQTSYIYLQIDKAGDRVLLSDKYQVNLITRC